ncbi:P-loop containing nucleoside triphosphate hydrolase protein [Amylostereum chailletii]|nr:P-loop containing nucleoside triphosphate hydrolase protein [Amylostereum chailletii]
MSRTGLASRSTAPTPVPEDIQAHSAPLAPHSPPIPTTSRTIKHQASNSQGDSETNIQVVIRCRRRSDKEVQESSPIVVSSDGPRSTSITIETAMPSSSLGVVTLPPTRTYPFDVVFGPEADQSMIYNEVVSPMLDEVLQGYNCTLFAYGQTGTGKTHTMQGDLGTTPMGNPTAQAGMIPRVLFRLFHQLEASNSDYSVKISYVELYNEELRDLLSTELSVPSGNVQPMGMGSRDAAQGGLKIFDDASKKGVLIQGLEEIAVKSSSDALALLVKGSDRRQIAATKFNDHSSRSHSVFSITVHTKETSSMGDDLLRVGKMNLVDLAGSENIGRSGAENKRAREAGMINQSLLTLGRVINALVERSSHIPYRESKLTRLLQDSLGGRTKTCIIATISPARSNMEETLSTLDYAIRAKSIRNRPEVNQRLTRNALLKEYIGEIERLKADVLAAREKNGIFFSEDTWNQMSVEHELTKTEMEEAKRQVEIVESQLRSVREEFEESMNLLMKTDGELKNTRNKLSKTEDTLQFRETELQVTKGALEEEVIVRKAYQSNEAALDEVARGLKATVHESLSDIDALHGKLARKAAVFQSNTTAVLKQTKNISGDTQKLSAELDTFAKASTQTLSKLRTDAEQHQVQEAEALAVHSNRVNEHIKRMQEALQVIHAKDETSSEAVESAQVAVKEAHDGIRASFAVWSEKFKSSSVSMYTEIEKASLTGYQTMDRAINAMSQLVETIVREERENIDREHKAILEAKTLTEATANEEMRHLQEQNVYLAQLLQTERAKSDRAKDDLIKRISSLLGDFVVDRDRSLKDAFADISDGNKKAHGALAAFTDEHSQRTQGIVTRGQDRILTLETSSGENKRLRDGSLKALNAVNNTLRDGFANIQSTTATSLSTYSGELHRQTHAFNTTSSDAFERHRRAKKARIDATNALNVDTQSGLRQLQRGIASTSRNIETHTSRIMSESSKLLDTAQSYHATSKSRLSSVISTAHSLMDQGAREDLPTGKTPAKRIRNFVDHWELTKGRDLLLKDHKRHLSTSAEAGLVSGTSPSSAWEEPGEEDRTIRMRIRTEDPSPLSPASNSSTLQPGEENGEPEVDSIPLAESPISLASSTSSVGVFSLEPPSMKGKLAIGIPKSHIGTLTERSTNVMANRGPLSRRAR